MSATDLLPIGAENSQAVISPCGRYRYWLRRVLKGQGGNPAVFVMLNPSTADADNDDPTIRRCKTFAAAWGYNELIVVNLFAQRTTEPRELFKADDPVGPDNHQWVLKAAEMAASTDDDALFLHNKVRPSGIVICAWGAHGSFMDQGATVRSWIETAGAAPRHLGLTKEGHPRHPLYLPATLKPIRWK